MRITQHPKVNFNVPTTAIANDLVQSLNFMTSFTVTQMLTTYIDKSQLTSIKICHLKTAHQRVSC